MEKCIDIIIPAYKAQNTLFRTLSSITIQNIKHLIKVTIVNDNPKEDDYSNFVEMFKNEFDIQELKMSDNLGPGAARQYGFDNTNLSYVYFCDADDCFVDCQSLLYLLLYFLQDPKISISAGCVLESGRYDSETNLPCQPTVVQMPKNRLLHGKMFKREFINNFAIKFPIGTYNEDVCYVESCLLQLNANNLIAEDDHLIYTRIYNPNSVTQSGTKFREHELEHLVDNFKFCTKNVSSRNVNQYLWLALDKINLFYHCYNMLFVEKINEEFPYIVTNAEKGLRDFSEYLKERFGDAITLDIVFNYRLSYLADHKEDYPSMIYGKIEFKEFLKEYLPWLK